LPVLFVYRKKKEMETMSRAKNPKYESMSLEELKANMEKSKKELEQAIHNMLEKTQKE
jgi:exonuclease I